MTMVAILPVKSEKGALSYRAVARIPMWQRAGKEMRSLESCLARPSKTPGVPLKFIDFLSEGSQKAEPWIGLDKFAICEEYRSWRAEMHIISKKKLREFWEKYSQAKSSMEAWYQAVKKAKWSNFADVRKTFNAADLVGRFVVFDIGGNKFRLIAAIHFNRGKLFVRHVLTHGEYDAGKWKED